jgi:Xaa-Pro aminopeptidase
MVLTAEIGLYIPEQNFGIRLEDDIVVTDQGPVNMSGALSASLEELGRL